MFQLVVVALIVSAVGGRKFQNPVIEGGAGYYRPGVILHGGQYYAVTSALTNEVGKLAIHVSSDLQTWHDAGYALPDGYIPEWTSGCWTPEIHKIGEDNFRLFFFTQDRETQKYAIAVGASQNILGPYVVQDRPLQLNLTDNSYDASLVQDGGRKYLVWHSTDGILGRELNPDCFDFIAGSSPKLLLPANLPWEGNQVRAPWVVHRPDGWYMFYAGNTECTELSAVGVARSQNPLGPFEKRGDPILSSNFDFQGPGQISVVSDIYIGTTAMLYHATKSGNEECAANATGILSQTVDWEDDGWPIIIST